MTYPRSVENWATNQKLLLVVCRSVTAFSQFFFTPSLRITLNRVWIEYAVIFIVMIFSSRDYDDIRLQAISHKSQVFFGTMASLKMVWFEFWIVNLKFYMLVLYKKNVISSMHFLKVWKWQKQKRIARFALQTAFSVPSVFWPEKYWSEKCSGFFSRFQVRTRKVVLTVLSLEMTRQPLALAATMVATELRCRGPPPPAAPYSPTRCQLQPLSFFHPSLSLSCPGLLLPSIPPERPHKKFDWPI